MYIFVSKEKIDKYTYLYMYICIYVYMYVCRTFGVYFRKALVAIFNTMSSGAGPGLADLKFRNFRNFRNSKYF